MAQGAQDVQAELQEYLNKKGINTLFIKIVEHLLLEKPDNPVKHVVEYLMKQYPEETGGISTSGQFSLEQKKADLDFDDDLDSDEEDDDFGELVELPPKAMPVARSRRVSVSAASGGIDKLQLAFDSRKSQGSKKSAGDKKRIMEVLDRNVLFLNLDSSQVDKLLFEFFEVDVAAGEVLIKQGDVGDNFYLIEDGKFEVFVKNGDEEKMVATCTPEEHNAFGELALMYNAPRAATVVAATSGKLWALDRVAFKYILMSTFTKKRQTYADFLAEVPILGSLEENERMEVAEALEQQEYKDGDVIIKEGDSGNTFYIVERGSVKCVQQPTAGSEPVELCVLKTGDYFGEIALLTNRPRAASVIATTDTKVLCIRRKTFMRVMGPVSELLKRNMELYTKYMAKNI
jgi:cAMP-dependent protein kinase regulator|eukprot:Stramenopile-MAST_4_protein_1977